MKRIKKTKNSYYAVFRYYTNIMKRKKFFYLLPVLSVIYAFTLQDFCKKDIYILLDKNSKNIEYREYNKMRDTLSLQDRSYSLKTNMGSLSDSDIRIIFSHLQVIEFDRQDEVVKKPVSFLDSISYYDEHYIMKAKHIWLNEFQTEKLKQSKVFVIDKGTSNNDSLMMYEVRIGYSGFKE